MSSSTTGVGAAGLGRSRSLRRPMTINTAGGSGNHSTKTGGGDATGPKSVTSLRDDTTSTSTRSGSASPSRLPVKGGPASLAAHSGGTTSISSGLSRSSSVRVGGAAETSIGSSIGNALKKTRPISGLFGRANSVRQPPSQREATTTNEPSRPPITTRNRVPTGGSGTSTTARTPSWAGPTASSASRPTTSSGVPAAATKPKPTGLGHSRTKSSATALTTSTILRPPGHVAAAAAAAATGAVTVVNNSSTEREQPPATVVQNTTASAHRRQRSANPGLSSASARGAIPSTVSTSTSTTTSRQVQIHQLPHPSHPPSTKPPPPATTADLTSRLRPAFTAFQQHYSPAKSLAPKPLTASYLAPPSPSKLPANVAASAETSRLQTELLHLHLLHSDSGAVDAAWRDSARDRLGKQFAGLVARDGEVRGLEASLVERENVAALRDWIGGGSGGGIALLDDKIQTLDAVLTVLWGLGDPGGRYAKVVRRFGRWAEAVGEVVERRGRLHGPGQSKVVFVSELDASWKNECGGLARRLDECRRMLRDLGDGPASLGGDDDNNNKSSLAVILAACRRLVLDMLAELDMMEQMERDALAQENEWVRAANRDGGDGGASDDVDVQPQRGAGAIWRAF
jgi:hypothetical protein